jgi:hypothetical protein
MRVVSKPVGSPRVSYERAMGLTFRWMWITIGCMFGVAGAGALSTVVGPAIVGVPLFFVGVVVSLVQLLRHVAAVFRWRRQALRSGQIAYSKLRFTDDHPVIALLITLVVVAAVVYLVRHH